VYVYKNHKYIHPDAKPRPEHVLQRMQKISGLLKMLVCRTPRKADINTHLDS